MAKRLLRYTEKHYKAIDVMGDKLKVLAIVPAYNEEANIVSTVEDLSRNAPGVDHVVINDGSSDATEAICLKHGFNIITLPVNLGLAGGFQTGMKYAYAHDYDFAIQFDADGSILRLIFGPWCIRPRRTALISSLARDSARRKSRFPLEWWGSALITP